MALRVPLTLLLLCIASCARNAAAPDAAEVAVRVRELVVDREIGAPVVVLEELGGARELQIVIGAAEAESIAWKLHDEKPPRPNSHDLTKRLLDRLDGVVERVVVSELRDGVYYARILLSAQGESHAVDARPSDAIAIALRMGAPLFVHEALLMEAGAEPSEPPDGEAGPFDAEPADDRQVESRSL